MSRLFASASSQFGNIASALVSGAPLTISAWIMPTTSVATNDIASVNDGGSNNCLLLRQHSTGTIRAFTSGGGTDFSETAGTVTNGVWAHAAAVFASATSRQAFLNGTAAGINATNLTPLGMVNTQIATTGTFYDGRIADVGMWNVALSQDEITALAAGFPPSMVRPSALVGYWPLWGDDSPEPDWNPSGTVNGLPLSNGPTKADHTPVVPSWLVLANVSGLDSTFVAPYFPPFADPTQPVWRM